MPMEPVKPFLNEYLLSLIHRKGLTDQFVSSFCEFRSDGERDPLHEELFLKSKGLVHRYPDRVVLVVTNRCFAYCRFCFRKRNWEDFDGFDLEGALEYITSKREIREVLISGGDPLTLTDERLIDIVEKLRRIDHIELIRIGTRVFTVYPLRVNKSLIDGLKPYKPVWIAMHVNHPDEITAEFEEAVSLFVDNGFPVVSQTVLLRRINDDVGILKRLFCRLVRMGVKPYYLFGCDPATGNAHFRVELERAISIMSSLRGFVSGLCVPAFAFDLPDGGGKIVLEPSLPLKEASDGVYRFKNFEGDEYEYREI